ncbi:PDC2 [[Candida] subhashii]|uniref:PDC2 n=1 Tax=[Candida] subhashii TaxID=561895 RepID=A0A8J5QMI7_9ASCO|nr:PDC2 [[Candida] subhashii]KAG7663022.1 PDC2 [[Candida] subhashii]
MGYTIKQKIDICLKAEANPHMTQIDLANWVMTEYGTKKPPSQTTISRILNSKNDLIASKETDFQLVRRRKQTNPLLRRILTEWITQAIWENIPITTPIIQSTANAIWTRLPKEEKDGNGVFNQKWCSHFIKRLNIDLTGYKKGDYMKLNDKYPLNKVWKLDEKIELKGFLYDLIKKENYSPQDIFVLDEFQLFYSLPLDQIFDVSSIDKGLKQSKSTTENSLTIMLGCNIDGSEKLAPLIVGKYDTFDISKTTHQSLKNVIPHAVSPQTLMNKITEAYRIFYKSNTNKWITSSMFQNYLLTLDHKIHSATPTRKILILLDDSSSHRIINLKFTNIRLCYLKNDANHKNPYNTTYSGVKFDYLPMNFGIIEEFKILYRLQQYLEMINLQRNNSKPTTTTNTTGKSSTTNSSPQQDDNSNPMTTATTPGSQMDLNTMSTTATATTLSSNINGLEVLSEEDYHIPIIRVIEWITRSWHSITQERIFSSWKKTHLFKLTGQDWPSDQTRQIASMTLDPLQIRLRDVYDPNKSYNKLAEIMGYLNVVIPWEIDELLGLVNERGKVTLSYASIEEIIGSCLSESYDGKKEGGMSDVDESLAGGGGSDENQWYNMNDSASAATTDNALFFNTKSSGFEFPLSEVVVEDHPSTTSSMEDSSNSKISDPPSVLSTTSQSAESLLPTSASSVVRLGGGGPDLESSSSSIPPIQITPPVLSSRFPSTSPPMIPLPPPPPTSVISGPSPMQYPSNESSIRLSTKHKSLPNNIDPNPWDTKRRRSGGQALSSSMSYEYPTLPPPPTSVLQQQQHIQQQSRLHMTASESAIGTSSSGGMYGGLTNSVRSPIGGFPKPPTASSSFQSPSVGHMGFPTTTTGNMPQIGGLIGGVVPGTSGGSGSGTPTGGSVNDFEVMNMLAKVIDMASSSDSIKLSENTLQELKYNLGMAQSKFGPSSGGGGSTGGGTT